MLCNFSVCAERRVVWQRRPQLLKDPLNVFSSFSGGISFHFSRRNTSHRLRAWTVSLLERLRQQVLQRQRLCAWFVLLVVRPRHHVRQRLRQQVWQRLRQQVLVRQRLRALARR